MSLNRTKNELSSADMNVVFPLIYPMIYPIDFNSKFNENIDLVLHLILCSNTFTKSRYCYSFIFLAPRRFEEEIKDRILLLDLPYI